MKRALELEDLYRIPHASDPQISPDGDRIAFVVSVADRERDTYLSRIWAVSTDGGEPVPLTRGDSDQAPRWSPDGRWLAFLSTREDDKVPQLWVLPVDGGEARRVSDLTHGVEDPQWSPDAASLAFLSKRELGDSHEGTEHHPVVVTSLDYQDDGVGLTRDLRRHLFVAAIDGEGPTQITEGDFSVEDPAWSPDGRYLAFVAAVHEERDLEPGASLFTVSAHGAELRRLGDDEWSASAPVWSADGQAVIFVGSRRLRVDHNRLLAAPASGGAARLIAPDFDRNVMVGGPAYPGARPRFAPGGKTILFCARDRGCTHVFAVPVAGGEIQKVAGGENSSISGMSLATAVDAMAFVAATPTTPSEIFVATTDGVDEKQLTHLFASALPDVGLHVPERRRFTSVDGREVEGWIILGGEKPGPLLLDIHGGPHNAWSPTFDGVHLYHQTLVAQGWTILFINSRGSDGYGGDWFSAVTGRWGEADYDDFIAAVDTLVEEGIADPERLSVTGYSYGGFMTNWIATRTSRFASAVTGGCISNLMSSFGSCDKGWPFAAIEMGARPEEKTGRWAELSPIEHVDDVETPMLILHGQSDDRCPIGQAKEWFSALRVRKKPVEFVLYPEASHLFLYLGRPSHRIDYSRRLAEWVTRHVPA